MLVHLGTHSWICTKSQQSVSDSDVNSSLSQKGRNLHHCQWCKCLQKHYWGLGWHFCHASQHCSLLLQLLLVQGEMHLSSTSWTWQEGKGLLLFSGVGLQLLFLETKGAQQLNFQTTHTLTAIQAGRLCHCSHERIICNYLFPAVYMWKMPQISTLSPLALNHLPSTSPSSRNKPHLGRSLHKRQTKSQPTAQCTPISMDRLCSCIVIVCFTCWKRWYFSAG